MSDDDGRLAHANAALRDAVGNDGWHEAAATAATFNQMDRIADATGIPIDPDARKMLAELGREIGAVNFASAKNTLQRL